MKFEVGDKIKVISDTFGKAYNGLVLEVVPEGKCTSADQGVWLDKRTAEVSWLNGCWIVNDFELVSRAVSKKPKRFQVGDRVISTKNTPEIPEGFVGYVVEAAEQDNYDYAISPVAGDSTGIVEYFNEDELELLSFNKDPDWRNRSDLSPQDIQGIARPILEERKIGKVQMNLFDEGFPNAVMEVAKVMSWASENKGYKPHDWKNLPNAETEFSAAASRHRVKGFIQKAEGVAAIDRTDEESNIVHLAHTAFNVLAELELVLTGKSK